MATVRYLVTDVNKALEFYVDHLAFGVIDHHGDVFARVERGGLSLWLSGPGSSAARPLADGTAPIPGGWNRIVIVVPDLDETVARLRTQHVKFRSDVVTGPGGRQILVEDGVGNLVELFEAA